MINFNPVVKRCWDYSRQVHEMLSSSQRQEHVAIMRERTETKAVRTKSPHHGGSKS